MTTTAVVTGAGRGIGLAFAHRLADDGHLVVVTDVDAAAAERAATEIGRGAVGLQQDVRDAASHRRIAQKAGELGALRVWVNNAGILFAGDAWTHTDDQFAAMFDVNIVGVVAGSAAAVAEMGSGGGTVLNMGSLSAFGPVPGLALYAASKAAVVSYTTSLQGDLQHAGLPIRACTLCPDVVGTEMVSSQQHDPGAALLFAGPKPLDATQVADAAVALIRGRQTFRVVPRWRGALMRGAALAPTAGVRALDVMRKLGDRRQSRS